MNQSPTAWEGRLPNSCHRVVGGNPLVSANAQLAAVLDAATQLSIIATDLDGTITLFNSGAEQMLGYTSNEVVGQHTPQLLHLEAEVHQRGLELTRQMGRPVEGFEVFVALAKQARFERREWTYVRRDGAHLTVNLVVTAVRNPAGEITGFLGTAEDISERKASEAALRKSEERFNLAVAGSNDGLWDWDIATNEIYYAPRFKELLGYAPHEFEDVLTVFEAHVHPDDRDHAFKRLHRHLKHREPYDVEYRLRTKAGAYRWFRARGQAVWNSAGRPVRMAGSVTDLTNRKLAEEAVERKAKEVEEANRTLRVAEAQARQAVVQRDQFLAMLSHELRNPLSAILSGLGVMEHARANHDAVDDARLAIRRQANHMARLLDDLLDVARITQGKIEFRKEIVDLNELVVEATRAARAVIERRQQHLSVIPSAGPVMVEGDPTRLLQIIDNLLTNASKYSSDGGAIVVEVEQDSDRCRLSVQDNGRGIDSQTLDKIFDMFFQSDSALDRSDGGIGVGLTLVRSLVEMHDGTVCAHSGGAGQGSEFVVRLPMTSKRPHASTPPSVAGDTSTRVLLVEDNRDSREMLQAILQLDGFEVTVAEDGQQGLDAILAAPPDVALIDIGLPKLNGYEVARKVREQLQDTRVRLVALTGYGQKKDFQAAMDAGFDEHLVKPVSPDALVRLLGRPRQPR